MVSRPRGGVPSLFVDIRAENDGNYGETFPPSFSFFQNSALKLLRTISDGRNARAGVYFIRFLQHNSTAMRNIPIYLRWKLRGFCAKHGEIADFIYRNAADDRNRAHAFLLHLLAIF